MPLNWRDVDWSVCLVCLLSCWLFFGRLVAICDPMCEMAIAQSPVLLPHLTIAFLLPKTMLDWVELSRAESSCNAYKREIFNWRSMLYVSVCVCVGTIRQLMSKWLITMVQFANSLIQKRIVHHQTLKSHLWNDFEFWTKQFRLISTHAIPFMLTIFGCEIYPSPLISLLWHQTHSMVMTKIHVYYTN